MIDEETQPPPTTHPPACGTGAGLSSTALVELWLADHGDVLWRFVLGRTRSREIAEEVVQETVLAAMRGHARFEGASTQRTWLLGIAAHKIADHFRAARRRGRGPDAKPSEDPETEGSSLSGLFTAEGMWANTPGAWGLDAADAIEQAELLAALRRCVEALPPSQAEAVWLRDLLNIPAGEVCKAMGISATNLWSRTHRARAALRACVEQAMRGRQEDMR